MYHQQTWELSSRRRPRCGSGSKPSGRLLRRSRTKEGAEKEATLYVLYASETVDELIYEKADSGAVHRG